MPFEPPHDKRRRASVDAVTGPSDTPRRASAESSRQAPFVGVPLNETTSASTTKPSPRPSRCPAWLSRAMTPGTVGAAVCRLVIFSTLLAATVTGYALAIVRISAMTQSMPADPAAPQASAPPAQDDGSSNGTDPNATTPDDQATLAATAPIFVHTLFAAAILVLIISIIRSLRALGRARVYGPDQTPEARWAAESGEDATTRRMSAATSPNRVVRVLLGAPPVKPPAPALPSYNQALQQSARQAARREAADANLPAWTAGRRGRELIGTCDSEDLEIERAKRLGGPPPGYRSDAMRDGPVLDRGSPGPRRRWRSSWLSVVASDDGAQSTRASRRVSAVTGMLSDLLRRFSFRAAGADWVDEPAPPVPHEPKSDVPLPSPIEMQQSRLSSPPLGSPASPSPRRIRFAELGHLRRRSSTNAVPRPTSDPSAATVVTIASPPTSAGSGVSGEGEVVLDMRGTAH